MPLNLGGNEINSLGAKLLNETQFVKTNLAYLWDAGLTSSYPGTGTSWYEWKDNTARTGTFTNGPYYSTIGGGSIYFDGSNDYVELPTFTLSSVPWSVSFWIKTTLMSQCGLFSHWSGGPVYNGFGLYLGRMQYVYYNNAGWNYSPVSSLPVSTDSWTYVTYSTGANATDTFRFYTNGEEAGTFPPTSNGIGSGNMGSFGSFWGWGYYNGYLAHCSVHSAQLTRAQILQNFNSTRPRFGV
jgi:hypothetical protein